MAQQQIRIYLKSGAIIEFESDGFGVDCGEGKPDGLHIGELQMGQTNFDLAYIDLKEVAAITRTSAQTH